jgi:hypothetical protein
LFFPADRKDLEVQRRRSNPTPTLPDRHRPWPKAGDGPERAVLTDVPKALRVSAREVALLRAFLSAEIDAILIDDGRKGEQE